MCPRARHTPVSMTFGILVIFHNTSQEKNIETEVEVTKITFRVYWEGLFPLKGVAKLTFHCTVLRYSKYMWEINITHSERRTHAPPRHT